MIGEWEGIWNYGNTKFGFQVAFKQNTDNNLMKIARNVAPTSDSTNESFMAYFWFL